MNTASRQIFFRLYAIFFILITPFIVIYSLGYNFDWQNQTLSKNLFIKVQTLPRGATVKISDSKAYTTPTEIRLSSDAPQEVSIKKSGYVPEEFTVWSDLNRNTNTYLDKIILLPTSKEAISDLPSGSEALALLPQSKILLYRDNQLLLQSYSTNSVNSPESVSGDINPDTFSNEDDWIYQNQDFIWNKDKKIILYRDEISLKWRVEDLQETILGIENLARVSNSTFLVLDSDSNLYTYRPQDQRISFLDSGFQGLFGNPNSESIWLVKGNDIIRLNKNRVNYNNILESNENFVYSSVARDFDFEGDLEVADIYRGVVVKAGTELYFLQETEPEIPNLLTNNAQDFTTTNNTVFWVNEGGLVQSYNFEFNIQKNLATFDNISDTANLFYSNEFGRLILYSEDIKTIWTNPTNRSSNIKEHSKNTWINNSLCQKYTEDRNQICIDNDTLIKYQNVSRF